MQIRGGTDRLPKAFANALTVPIHFGAEVKHVEQKQDVVLLTITGGWSVFVDRALCTIPLPVMSKIKFTPVLSAQKEKECSGGFRYRSATRVFIQFQQRFWEAEGFNGWGITDWPE